MDINTRSKVEDINKEITLVNINGKVTIMSPYELNKEEQQKIREIFPGIANLEIVNIVDKNIYSGLIIKIGTKMIDLSLNSALQNLRKQIYESH